MATAILLPGGAGGQAFAVYPNFNVIRRYNPSNYYALVVGMLSDRVA
jgi:membrane-bound lytic murein transglycosylase B